MNVYVETLSELKKIRFSRYSKISCQETQREYFLIENGSLTPDDLNIVLPVQGGNWRLVAQEAAGGGGGGGGDSAFPWPVKIISSDTTLTPADQGIIVQMGGIITLPASAPNGTIYRIYGSPGDVRINSNGNPIAGIGTGSDLRPGEPALQLVAVNVPGLIWATENRKFASYWHANRSYRLTEIVKDYDNNLYLSRSEGNTNNALSNQAHWLPISPRRLSGSISLSDLSFTATTPPTALISGTYEIVESGRMYMISIDLLFSGASAGVSAVDITITKASEIRDAFSLTFGVGPSEEDVVGYGHANSNSGFGAAVPANVYYSPTNMEYIRTTFSPISNLARVNIRIPLLRL